MPTDLLAYPRTAGSLVGNAPVEDNSQPLLSKTLDVLNRTSMASGAGLQRGPGAFLHTLLHSESPQQYQQDTEALTQKLMMTSPEEYKNLPGWRRKMNEIATQIIIDPTTYVGGLGLTRAGIEQLTTRMLPAAMKSASALAKIPIGKDIVDTLGPWTAKLHDALTPGGQGAAHAERVEALTHGRQGILNTRSLYSLHNARGHVEADLEEALNTGYDRATKGLSDTDKLKVFKAIDGGYINRLPDNLKAAAQGIQTYDRGIAFLRGSRATQARLAKSGYHLPADLERFNTRTRNLPGQFMENHVPMPHEFSPEEQLKMGLQAPVRGRTSIKVQNPQFKPRGPGFGPEEDMYSIEDPKLHEKLFKASFKRAAREVANSDLQRKLAEGFGKRELGGRRLAVTNEATDQAIKAYNEAHPYKTLTREEFDQLSPSVQEVMVNPYRGSVPTRTTIRASTIPKHIRGYFEKAGKPINPDLQRLPDLLRGVSDVSRSALFTTPFQHSTRIASLLALQAPEAFPEALAKFARTKGGLAGSEAQARVLGRGQAAGAVGAKNIEQGKLEEVLNKGGAPGRLAAKYFAAVGKMLWGWDAAAKDALFTVYLKRYKDPLQAAYHVQKDLVNYGHSSPFIEGARTISSFPTWRTRMPIAVGRAMVREPQNAAALAKTPLGQFLMGKETGEPGDTTRKRLGASAPAELTGTSKNIGDAARKYLIGSLNPSTRLAGYAAMRAALRSKGGDKQARSAFLYGKSPAEYTKATLPFVGQASELSGHGLFPSTPKEGMMESTFGIESIHPWGWAPLSKPAPTQKAKGPVDLLKGTP